MENFDYEFISQEDKLAIAETQLKELEGAHFSLMMIEPSRITDAQAYGQWNQQHRWRPLRGTCRLGPPWR